MARAALITISICLVQAVPTTKNSAKLMQASDACATLQQTQGVYGASTSKTLTIQSGTSINGGGNLGRAGIDNDKMNKITVEPHCTAIACSTFAIDAPFPFSQWGCGTKSVFTEGSGQHVPKGVSSITCTCNAPPPSPPWACSSDADCNFETCASLGARTMCTSGECYAGSNDAACSGLADGTKPASFTSNDFWCWQGRKDTYCPSSPSQEVECHTDADCLAKSSCDGTRTVCHKNMCFTGSAATECAGAANGAEGAAEGSWCFDGRADRKC